MAQRHQDLTANHILESFVYANSAARTSATGFVPGDIGRIAFQQDNSTYWRLTATTPTWIAFQNNIVESFTYANTAARTGATGFVAGDVGKLAYQTDTAQYWRLFAQTAGVPTWLLVAPNQMQTWTYATANDRTTATGFVANDVGRIAYQNDIGAYYRLTATTPTWQSIVSGSDPINSAVTGQTAAFAADTYVTNSSCVVGVGEFKAKTQYRCVFDMIKTAAGTATPIISIRIGTTGTTADPALITFTFGNGTAVGDWGVFEVWVNFRSVGTGTSAVISAMCRGTHPLTTTGLFNNGQVYTPAAVSSSGFNSSTATTIGISFNGGASFSGSSGAAQAALDQP